MHNFQEEQNRRLAQDQKKREEQMKIAAVKKRLKTTKEQKKLLRKTSDRSDAMTYFDIIADFKFRVFFHFSSILLALCIWH